MSKTRRYAEALGSDPVAQRWDKLLPDRRSPQLGMDGLPQNFTASPQLAAALDATTGLITEADDGSPDD